ncbi:MAG: hypothetical protein A2Y15_08080 [Clostridiales bacterium GWF2_36_10]|nr:MAG: hypothetical protein A2Y15_08080 [Clostridiales bacterium GWF2_36_10]HAN21838.1 hypothetical protein [Clostridiales bacterium]
MTKTELYEIFTAKGLDINENVCFNDNTNDNTKDDIFHVKKNYYIWEVFYLERGKENDLKKFNTESDALEYLYDILKKIYKL